MVVRGALMPIVGTTLLIVWGHETGEPARPALALLLLFFGAMISALLALELFIPRRIRFGESFVFYGEARTVEWIRYTKLVSCEVSSSPHLQILGFGPASEVLFALYLDPRVDLEALASFLTQKGVAFRRVAAQPLAGSRIEARRL